MKRWVGTCDATCQATIKTPVPLPTPNCCRVSSRSSSTLPQRKCAPKGGAGSETRARRDFPELDRYCSLRPIQPPYTDDVRQQTDALTASRTHWRISWWRSRRTTVTPGKKATGSTTKSGTSMRPSSRSTAPQRHGLAADGRGGRIRDPRAQGHLVIARRLDRAPHDQRRTRREWWQRHRFFRRRSRAVTVVGDPEDHTGPQRCRKPAARRRCREHTRRGHR